MAHILVIDDDAQIRKMLKILLEREGYHVAVAADGEEGLRIVQDTGVDLVITDIIMPNKEGIETIITLKRVFPHVKIIAISGGSRFGAGNYMKLLEGIQVHGSFPKPLNPHEFLKGVRKILQSSEGN